MNEFIEVLRKIESDDSIKYKKYLTNGYHDKLPKLIKKVVNDADKLLITKVGAPDFSRIKILKDNGFDVFAGEKDSFGWLSGCIKTKKGIIVFG